VSSDRGSSGGPPARRTALAALFVVWVVWGSTYLAIRVGVRTIPPFTLAAIRYAIAGAILVPIGLRSGGAAARRRDRPRGRQWAAMLLLGAMLPAGGNGVVSWAELRLPSGTAALLVASVPLWMVITDAVATRRLPGALRWLALAVGLGGVAVLSGTGAGGVPVGATAAALLASLSWGIGSALQPRLPTPSRALLVGGMEMLCGGLVLAVVAAVRGELAFDIGQVSAQSWWALAYLIGPGTLLAMTCYLYALGRLPSATVSSYAFVNPVVAVALGAVLLDERLSGTQLLGGALVALAVAGLLGRRRRLPQTAGGEPIETSLAPGRAADSDDPPLPTEDPLAEKMMHGADRDSRTGSSPPGRHDAAGIVKLGHRPA
jgi:drug/metabolite transporter (DMT)-like permease